MKSITSIIVTAGLFLGFVSSSYAVSLGPGIANQANGRIEQYRATVSPESMLKYNQILLERSTVAVKLKFSSNREEKTRYAEAVDIYKKAIQAQHDGNPHDVKKLALESIRIIAKTVPHYYSRMAKADQ